MKFSAQEEYGIRCLIQAGKAFKHDKALTIPEISKLEGLSQHNVAKILRVLRLGGFLESARGHTGGYTLTRPPEKIMLGDVLTVLGGKLFDEEFCNTHTGAFDICSNTTDCSIRSLWKIIQDSIDSVIDKLSLKDLMGNEDDTYFKLMEAFENSDQ